METRNVSGKHDVVVRMMAQRCCEWTGEKRALVCECTSVGVLAFASPDAQKNALHVHKLRALIRSSINVGAPMHVLELSFAMSSILLKFSRMYMNEAVPSSESYVQ